MATFKEIRGQLIKKYTTNPTNPLLGQMWYNNTTGTLKVYRNLGGAWASGGLMNTARTTGASGGTQTANVVMSGQLSNAPYGPTNAVELYDGTSWTNNPSSSPVTAGWVSGTGTQTAALGFGGYPNVNTTFEFDGSSFSVTGVLTTARGLISTNIGTQTAAAASTGAVVGPSPAYPTQTEEYNGSTWTAGGAANVPGYGRAGSGILSAAVMSGGYTPAGWLDDAEEYDGTSWTSVNARPYAANSSGTSGTQTASLAFGGNPSLQLTTTVSYDGTNWSAGGAMTTGRSMFGSSAAGTSAAALASAGAAPGATEEYVDPTISIQTVTTS